MLPYTTFSLHLFQFYGVICAAMAYVVVVTLSYFCVREFISGKASSCYSTPKRRFNILYITSLLLLSTFSLIHQVYGTTMAAFLNKWGTVGERWFETVPVALPFTAWAADGFMIWRCMVLYQGISPKYRILLISILSLLASILLAAGVIYLLPLSTPKIIISLDSSSLSTLISAAALLVPTASTIANIILSALIVFRILYHQRYLRRALGTAHTSVYSRIVAICIESCALIVVVGVVQMVLLLILSPGNVIALYLLPHICVISPLMIIYRVAHRRDATSMMASLSVGNMIEREIHFITPNSTPEIVEGV